MAKTELTSEMERQIYTATKKKGVFACFEVTIGWFGKERVDYITYDTKGIWRCYEVKVSLADFRSKANKTFCGHFNYYVMPEELYEKVKDEIPKHIGVYLGGTLVKRARKQVLTVDEQVLKDSLIRSLYREADKTIRSKNPAVVDSLQRQLRNERKQKEEYRRKYQEERRRRVPRSATR
ncbi:hypothetical protein FT641_19165 [Bacillus paranthracis]|uniref:hypothetical protein n=1 Tax=Bacillus paranthracis TaxID=2026186 RepID=UPI001879ACEC|nr:hypothetical protein [Bacillus paranthracis]MBE7114313.1 hypothetical protein [Bacillus paranthracis]MBE7154814.1 hypothetical protein [Bacillus paranthracis]